VKVSQYRFNQTKTKVTVSQYRFLPKQSQK